MIVSKHGKTYDTSNGSEQQFGPATPPGAQAVHGNGGMGKGRWSDDGGKSSSTPLVIVGPLAWKPEWSVLSLKDLNSAIDRERADAPARRAREEEGAERARVHNVIVEADRLAEAAREKYRNAWEHS